MTEEKQRAKTDFLGLLTLLVVAGSVFAGMWMTVEIVNTQSEIAIDRIDSSASMVQLLHHENRELRDLLKQTLGEVQALREGQAAPVAPAAEAATADAVEVAAAQPAEHGHGE